MTEAERCAKAWAKGSDYILKRIPDALWMDVRRRAVEERITLKELILRALREYLER